MKKPTVISGVLNRKPKRETIYVAGPIGQAEHHDTNAKAAMEIGHKLLAIGLHPFVPHLCIWWDRHMPRHYEEWMKYDLIWIKRCDALFRLPGTSPGADREVVFARQNNIPVFFELADVILWARK